MDGDQLHYGYPYPPIALFFTALSECFFRDFRIGYAVALGAAAVLISRMQRNEHSCVIALLFITAPSTSFILNQGWIEPLSLFLLAVASWCWFRAPRAFPFVLGLFFVSKQYLLPLFPLVFLLAPGPLRSRSTMMFLAKVVGAMCTVTLPLALLNLPAFVHSVVLAHVRTPFRADSMSYAIWFPHNMRSVWSLVSFALCLFVMAVFLCSRKRGYKNFLLALTTALFAFFIFNKQAFANYYYFVSSSIWLLLSVSAGDRASNSLTPVIETKRQLEPVAVLS